MRASIGLLVLLGLVALAWLVVQRLESPEHDGEIIERTDAGPGGVRAPPPRGAEAPAPLAPSERVDVPSPVVTAPPATAAPAQTATAPGGTVLVTVTDADSVARIPSLKVQLEHVVSKDESFGSSTSLAHEATTDAAGVATFSGVERGEYVAVASDPSWSKAEAEVTLLAEETVHATLSLRKSATVIGVVVDARGDPFPGVSVVLRWESPSAVSESDAWGDTDAAGAFKIAPVPISPETSYSLMLRHDWTRGAGQKVAFEPSPGATIDVGRVTFRLSGATVRGRLVRPDGSAPPQRTVTISKDDAKDPFPRNARSADDGSFSIGGLESGPHVLSVDRDCIAGARPTISIENADATIDLGAIVLSTESLFLRGRVLDLDGAPAIGATVEFRGQSLATDENGAFSIGSCDGSPAPLKVTYTPPDEPAGAFVIRRPEARAGREPLELRVERKGVWIHLNGRVAPQQRTPLFVSVTLVSGNHRQRRTYTDVGTWVRCDVLDSGEWDLEVAVEGQAPVSRKLVFDRGVGDREEFIEIDVKPPR